MSKFGPVVSIQDELYKDITTLQSAVQRVTTFASQERYIMALMHAQLALTSMGKVIARLAERAYNHDHGSS